VRQTEIVIGVEQDQLLTQPCFVFTHRVDPPADRGDMLTEVEVEALDERRVDLPAAGR
jgi:hypothetical protein